MTDMWTEPSSSSSAAASSAAMMPFTTILLSGAAAGFSEHVAMYPMDTVKTRMQVANARLTTVGVCRQILMHEGALRLYRGLPAVLIGAIPSHAAYFSAIEASRAALNKSSLSDPVINGLAGACGTMAHDLIVTPLDVVKQRLQVSGSRYHGTLHCLKDILKHSHGFRTLFASYPTTLIMNVPFMAILVSSYESIKTFCTERDLVHGTKQHILAAGIAGGLSGLITTPLDVVKTTIQTKGVSAGVSTALFEASSKIYSKHGLSGFMKGSSARALYFMPSAAIVWSTYEFVKSVLGVELEMDDDDLLPH